MIIETHIFVKTLPVLELAASAVGYVKSCYHMHYSRSGDSGNLRPYPWIHRIVWRLSRRKAVKPDASDSTSISTEVTINAEFKIFRLRVSILGWCSAVSLMMLETSYCSFICDAINGAFNHSEAYFLEDFATSNKIGIVRRTKLPTIKATVNTATNSSIFWYAIAYQYHTFE